MLITQNTQLYLTLEEAVELLISKTVKQKPLSTKHCVSQINTILESTKKYNEKIPNFLHKQIGKKRNLNQNLHQFQKFFLKKEEQGLNEILHLIKEHPLANEDLASSYFKKKTVTEELQFIYLKVHSNLYLFNQCFVPDLQKYTITVILTQTNFDYFFSYLQLCKKANKLIPLITSKSIWGVLSSIIQRLWGKCSIQLFMQCEEYQSQNYVRILNNEQISSFDFESSNIVMKKNLWYSESNDVMILLKGKKYIIECIGVKDGESIHSAWRNGVIPENEYCRIIDKTLFSKNQAEWSSGGEENFNSLSESLCHYISPLNLKFINLAKCELFMTIPFEIVYEIYLNGEILKYKKGQVLYRQNMILSKFFVILDGSLMVRKQESQQIIENSACFNRTSITKDKQKLRDQSLICHSNECQVFSIDILILKFLLAHYVQQLKDIQMCEETECFLSQWTKKVVTYAAKNDSHHSEQFSKLILCPGKKISNSLWNKICWRDLRILFETSQTDNQ